MKYISILLLLFVASLTRAGEEEYYRLISISTPKSQTDSRSAAWKAAPDSLVLEVSGLCKLDGGRLGVTIRKGEVWILGGVYDDPPSNVTYHRFASGLHEPLGLIWHNGEFISAQRTELTAMRDSDGDDVADIYRTVAKGWGVTGHYHEYAYGPKLDGQGNLWFTLNMGLGLKDDQLKRAIREPTLKVEQGRWRGWAMQVGTDGKLIPIAAGMRSPCGLGANAVGDMFYTDQQGNWVGTNSLHHLRPGIFTHHPESLASQNIPGAPVHGIKTLPDGLPFPEALKRLPQMVPPAVWLPYKKIGQSSTDIMLDSSDGKFGPFSGQLFIGEFTLAGMNRVFLEKVDGEYQGAAFPFRQGFASAVLRLCQGDDGSVFAGLTNRGWSSLGTSGYGLQRLVWTGKNPFEIREMRALPDGFDLEFTQAVDPATAGDVASYTLSSYTYTYHATYGSDEIQTQALKIKSATVAEDGKTVRLNVEGLRPLYVHELVAAGVRSSEGQPLLHKDAYYTLNRLPKATDIKTK